MASKLTKDGLILPDTGDFKQEKTVISVEGVEADNEGKIVLSSDQNKTLDQRMTEIDNSVDGKLLDIENRLSSVESGPTNLFLDSSLIVIQSQEITDWTYAPNNNETYPVVDHTVPEFENFFDNHLDKHKLSIHTGDSYSEVLVDDLKAFFDTPNELSTTLGAPVNQQEVFNNWTRFSHWDGHDRGSNGVGSTSGAFPANVSDTQAWVYDATTGDIVCTKNTDTLTGFVSQQKYEDYFYQTTLSSTAVDNDIISVVLAFVTDPDGSEHTITAVRLTSYQYNLVLDAGQYTKADMQAAAYTDAQFTSYTPTTSWLGTPSAWALVYNLGQSNAKVLVNGDSTAPALWTGDTTSNHPQTTGDDTLYAWGDGNHTNSTDDGTSIHTTVVRVRRQGNGFEAWCSQWNQSDVDSATKLTLDLDSDSDLLRFKGKQSYGVSSMSQESSRFSNQKFAETEFTFWYDSSDYDNRNVFQLRNNDLVLKQYSSYAGSEHFKVYRIDLHPQSTDPSSSSSGTVTSVNNILPNSTGNVTIPLVDAYTKTEVDSLISTSVVTNLFLDRSLLDAPTSVVNTNFLYGPSTQSGMNHTVSSFENFKTNSEYTNAYMLKVHSVSGNYELLIDDLMNYNNGSPDATNSVAFGYDNTGRDVGIDAYFIGNDLIIRVGTSTLVEDSSDAHVFEPYRIDLHKYVDSTTDVYTKSEVDSLVSSSGGGFTNRKVVTSSTTWTVPAGVDKVKISITGPGGIGGTYNGGTAGGTASAIYDVTGGTTQLTITLANYGGSNSRVTFSDRTGHLEGGSGKDGGVASITATTNLLTDSSLLITGGLPADLQSGNNSITGGASIYGTGPAYGGGGGANRGASGVGAAVVVLEY